MKKKTIARIPRLTVWIILLVISVASIADGQYELSWSTIDGGGGTSSGGGYTLIGTIGQPDAGVVAGGDFALMGGFWTGSYDCIVDMEAFGKFAANWLGGSGLPADLNGDGEVDIVDFAMLVDAWLCYCPGDWALK